MTKRKLLSLLLTLAMCLSLAVPAFAASNETHITILGTSDMHADIWGYDYADNKETSDSPTFSRSAPRKRTYCWWMPATTSRAPS